MLPPRVKICCISSLEEARIAIRQGAAALGLVGPMPSGPGVIDDVQIRKIARSVPPPIATFLLTSETTAAGIIAHYQRVLTSVIQLVDVVDPAVFPLLRKELPQVKLVQVIHVTDQTSVRYAIEIGRYVDAVLVDSGNPDLSVKELGGTGRTHDWTLSRIIRQKVEVPLFLAGGLTPSNVQEAIASVQPFGVDLCSGLRTDNELDEKKVAAFFRAL